MFTTPLSRVTRRSLRLRRLVATAVAVPLAVVGMVVVTAPAAQAASAAAVATTTGGFPLYYQDNANPGVRVEPCFNGGDANCVLPAVGAEPGFDPRQPTVFPTNFPSEFFYAYAQSTKVPTAGCNGTAPGNAFVTLALEGAFIGGAPKAGDQQVFGRVRIRVTSGLCANKAYTFRHPFGTTTVTTNGAGAVPANATNATTDVGCLAPTITSPCNFNQALGSPVLGGANGFLRWSAANPQPPAGYLGDGVTPHAIVGANGANSANSFTITGPNAANQNVQIATTTQFIVAGKVAGPLVASPASVNAGPVNLGQTSPSTVVTVTNVHSTRANLGSPAVTLASGAALNTGPFLVATSCLNGARLTRDQTCTITVQARPVAAGAISDTVQVSFGNVLPGRSPLRIPVTATGVDLGAPAATVTPNPVAFGDVRIRETKTVQVSVRNSGTAPLGITAASFTGADAARFSVADSTCIGTTVAVDATCTVDVLATPTLASGAGAKTANLVLASNVAGGTTTVPMTMTATGGVAAVSNEFLPVDGFPTWYRDENGVKLSQCIDPSDPYCIVLADATYNPAQPLKFLPTDANPVNFPGEFFYTVADSDLLSTPGCNGSAPGKSAYRSAIEGTFVNGEPIDTEQMVFGRERFYVTSGLCPGQTYTLTTPYGVKTAVAGPDGDIKRADGTTDVGCVPVAPALCAWDEALSSPVAGGFLRWDPAQAPAAPAGYIGDAASLHRVVGAPYSDGGTPANFFRVEGPGLPPGGISTNQFSVMGKLQGPLEATGGVSAQGTLVLAPTPVTTLSATKTLTLTNTGVAVGASSGAITVTSAVLGGVDGAEFQTSNDTCAGATLAAATTTTAAGTCTIDVAYIPTDTGLRSATLTFANSGLNDPLVVKLEGTGQANTGAAAFSFQPRSLAFGQLAANGTSKVETVTISNAGGTAPLIVTGFSLGGPLGAYDVTNRCTDPVPVDGTCQFDVVFSPTGAGGLNGTLFINDNTAAGTHSLPLTGSSFNGGSAVSATTGKFAFPNWYQDANGTRLEPCLDPQNCVLLGVPQPDQPLAVPDNFPGEFFYALADSEQITIPGCNGAADGTAILRVGLEGAFANTDPIPGDEITFTRVRLIQKGGLCPNVQNYQVISPYGAFTFSTDANGTVVAGTATQDTGCGANPCNFGAALASPGAFPVGTPIDGFLRWDPNVATPPAGYLGDATSFQKVIGGTYVKPGSSGAFNGFEIREPGAPNANLIAATDKWLVAGKVAGPLNTNVFSLDFGNVDQGAQSATQTVTVTNVGTATTAVTPSLTGAGAGQFAITGGTCGAGTVAVDTTCTVILRFAPSTSGAKTANLLLTPGTGRTATVALTGVANVVAQPNITVSPGILSYGTLTAPGTNTLFTTISNTGANALTVSAAAIAGGGGDYTFNGGTCAAVPFTVGAGGSCTIGVQFKPSVSGARTGTLTLTHNAAGGTTVVSLTGTGAGATWSVSPSPVGFGTVNRGTTKTSTLSVKNTGTANGTIVAATTVVSGLPFGIVANPATSTCFNGTAVAPGKTCNISVTFTPTAVQGYNGTLTIDGGASSLPRLNVVNLTGTGK